MKERFDQEFQALLDTDNPDARSMFTFVARTIRQFQLDAYGVTPNEVLGEVYARGVQFIQRGGTIDKPLGWIRSTALNVVREGYRKRKRFISLDTNPACEAETAVPCCMESLLEEEVIQENCQALEAALQRLSPTDREILYWRFVEGLSWYEVGKRLSNRQGRRVNETAVRQKGYRALQRLRQLFHEQKPRDPDDQIA